MSSWPDMLRKVRSSCLWRVVGRLLLAFPPMWLLVPAAWAGGPKYVAGVKYFNAGLAGQPVRWAGGQMNYFVDRGALNASVNNQQAMAMVDAAAALNWSATGETWLRVTTRGADMVRLGIADQRGDGIEWAGREGGVCAGDDCRRGDGHERHGGDGRREQRGDLHRAASVTTLCARSRAKAATGWCKWPRRRRSMAGHKPIRSP